MSRIPLLLFPACCLAASCTGMLGAPLGMNTASDQSTAVCVAAPGRVTLHRLNRTEYNNTVRDLMGTTLRPADDFPVDDRGAGYDNIADVLAVAPLLVEKYESAAELLVESALVGAAAVSHGEAESLGGTAGVVNGTTWNLYSNGSITLTFSPASAGTYRLRTRAYALQAGSEPARMTFSLNGVTAQTFDVLALAGNPQIYEATVSVASPTSSQFAAAFINDFYDATTGEDRNLYVDWLEVEGPLEGDSDSRARIMVCTPAPNDGGACARQILAGFATRAWRRPVAADEVDALSSLVELAALQGDNFDTGIKLGLQAVLLSPNFLFRVEENPAAGEVRPIGDYELASRLSYFLWSSMPDAALFEAAQAGGLNQPAAIAGQVDRMLADPRAGALVQNFGGQWLYFRDVTAVDRDSTLFPSFDTELKAAMRSETEQFFAALMDDGTVPELLTADFTFLNDRLAQHYGLPAVGGTTPQRVVVTGTRRGGILSHGSFLTVTSNPNRTSPVKRGKWILQQLLCTPPPPPPPGVVGLVEEVDPTASLRERMEAHRADPMCASCHSTLDPLGFALEHFNAVGAWRDNDEGSFAIDATGLLPDGRTFDGHQELAEILAADPGLLSCATKQMMTYAVGRELSYSDQCIVDGLAETLRASGGRFADLVHLVATSPQFRMRQAEVAP